MKTDANQALLSVVEGMNETIKTTGDMAAAFDAGGRVAGFALISLANNVDEFKTSLSTANDQAESNNSILKRFTRPSSKTSS